MADEPRGKVIPMPAAIYDWFRIETGQPNPWGAIQTMRQWLLDAEKRVVDYSAPRLDDVAQHLDAHIRLDPPLLDYAMRLSDVDDNGQVVIILIEGGYTEERINEFNGESHGYEVTLTGAPRYILHDGRKFRVESPEIYYRTVDPICFSPDLLSPMATASTKTEILKIQRFGNTMVYRSLNMPIDEIIRRFRLGMVRAIESSETHTVTRI